MSLAQLTSRHSLSATLIRKQPSHVWLYPKRHRCLARASPPRSKPPGPYTPYDIDVWCCPDWPATPGTRLLSHFVIKTLMQDFSEFRPPQAHG